MRIQASVGNAPKTQSLDTDVYKLTLTAQTDGERHFLAGLLKAIRGMSEWDMRLRNGYTPVEIRVNK